MPAEVAKQGKNYNSISDGMNGGAILEIQIGLTNLFFVSFSRNVRLRMSNNDSNHNNKNDV